MEPSLIISLTIGICLLAQGALSDACTASVDDLFPPQFNLSSIKEDLDNSPADVRAVVPSPLVGFTLFVASNAALDSNNNGTSSAIPAEDPSKQSHARRSLLKAQWACV